MGSTEHIGIEYLVNKLNCTFYWKSDKVRFLSWSESCLVSLLPKKSLNEFFKNYNLLSDLIIFVVSIIINRLLNYLL
jgi:hypothetical protein